MAPKADIRKAEKFVAAYTYNASTCVTGEELTCQKTDCYKTKTSGSCPAGTIIKYKVNDTDIVNFHVMFDKGSTITMQSQRNIVYNTMWSNNIATGPLIILPILESVTAGWSNVNNQTYTMGTTVLSKGNAYTGCSGPLPSQCTTNVYTLGSRTSRARMLSVQEASAMGCTTTAKSCPNWMNNYLSNSTSYGGTVNDTGKANYGSSNSGYWTMSAHSTSSNYAWYINGTGRADAGNPTYTYYGARAVVVVSK